MRTSITITILTLVAAAAVVLGPDGSPPTAAAAGSPALLQVIQSGGGRVQVQGPGLGDDQQCDQGFYSNDPCMYAGLQVGDTVTLTATSAGEAGFAGWSDARCQTGPVCTLTLADDQTVVAQFTPQELSVNVEEGNGDPWTLTISDGIRPPCTFSVDCERTFALHSRLELVATGNLPRFNPDDCEITQQSATRSTCTLVLRGDQRLNVAFNGATPGEGIPARVTVLVRANRSGNGSGTIRGALDCGSRCSVRAEFQRRVTLVADAASGSRFVRWSGGCGTNATCSVPAVPELRMTADFQRDAVTAPTPPPGPGPGPAYVARIESATASGRGAKRRVAIRVHVNRRSSLRARLTKGSRRVASKSYTVAKGTTTLRMRAPRARKGSHLLTVAFRAGSASLERSRNVQVKR